MSATTPPLTRLPRLAVRGITLPDASLLSGTARPVKVVRPAGRSTLTGRAVPKTWHR
jgi:hypothetical protein